MANRREFLQAGAAASIAAGIVMASDSALRGSAPATAGPVASGPIPLSLAVYDRRFPESREFGLESERLGIPVYAIEHDVTQLWLQELRPRWQSERTAVAGLTAECSFDCLKMLARDLGMRPVYHGEHLFDAGHRVHHTFSAAEAQLEQAGQIASAAQPWASHVAGLVRSCPGGVRRAAGTRSATTVDLTASRSRELEQVLISWVLAPVSRKRGPYA